MTTRVLARASMPSAGQGGGHRQGRRGRGVEEGILRGNEAD